MDNSWKKMIFGEKMPDKDDPKYKKRYEREVQAGKKFADKTGISWLVGVLQLYGQNHKKAFLGITFGFVLTLFFFNAARLMTAYRYSKSQPQTTAVEKVDSALHSIHRINH